MRFRSRTPNPPIDYPPLPLDLSKWGQRTTYRIYQVINGGSTSLGALQGLFTVDGQTIRVKPPSNEGKNVVRARGNAAKHRVFLVLPIVGGFREIPVGRVGQAFGRGLRRYKKGSET